MSPSSRCNVIVLGASAGGVTALGQLVSRLPADLAAAVAVALQLPENAPSVLPGILSRQGALPAVHATDGAPLVHGRIYVETDLVGRIDAIADELVRRVRRLVSDPEPRLDDNGNGDGEGEELDAVELDRGIPNTARWPEPPSSFTCPDCHGSLFELRDGAVTDFRCRTAHAYSPAALAAAQDHGVEAALWVALRALEEHFELLHRLQRRAHDRGQVRTADRFLAQARNVDARAAIIREALVRGDSPEVVA